MSRAGDRTVAFTYRWSEGNYARLPQLAADLHDIADSSGLVLLEQACAAVDGIAECAATIARDGRIIRGKFGPREHPLLKHELALRAFVCRTLQRLGLNLEPTNKSVGRPTGGIGWTPTT
jgi:hypothetical protein